MEDIVFEPSLESKLSNIEVNQCVCVCVCEFPKDLGLGGAEGAEAILGPGLGRSEGQVHESSGMLKVSSSLPPTYTPPHSLHILEGQTSTFLPKT